MTRTLHLFLHFISFFLCSCFFFFFFFNDPATPEIYPLSLHDALPISPYASAAANGPTAGLCCPSFHTDRKSTRLNSSHSQISYAVFCLKKNKKKKKQTTNKAAGRHTTRTGGKVLRA